MIIGYARVSTKEQNLERQIDLLKQAGAEKIITEKVSSQKKRPELEMMLSFLRSGDVVLVESLTRLARSTIELLQILESLENENIYLKSLNDGIDTSKPMGKFLITIVSAIAELERDNLVLRTNEGLKSARKRGRVGGRPRVEKKKLEHSLKLYNEGSSTIKEIVELTGVSKSTLYRYINQTK